MRRRSPRRRIFRTLLLAATLAGMAAPTALEAQRRDQMGRMQRLSPEAREMLEARIRARFAETVKTQLGLTDAEMVEVSEAFRSFEERRREIAAEERDLRQSLRPLLQPRGSAEQLGEEEARRILGRLAELRIEEAELFGVEQETLLRTLTPAQLLRLYQLREALGNRIRMLRGGGPPGGPGGRPGGPGGLPPMR